MFQNYFKMTEVIMGRIFEGDAFSFNNHRNTSKGGSLQPETSVVLQDAFSKVGYDADDVEY